jgi:hypothetical protein
MPGESFQSRVEAVGQDEDAFAAVACADLSRAEYAPRRAITEAFQFVDDGGETKADVAFDVFEEAHEGSHNSNSLCDERPEVARVFGAEPFTGGAEWLAGITSREDDHEVAKLFPREGLKIRPDRCRVQVSRFHFRNQICDRKGFDLTKSDCAQISDDSAESKVNAAVSSAETDVCSCFGSIHAMGVKNYRGG